MNYVNNLFTKGKWIHPCVLIKHSHDLNRNLYKYLMKNTSITRDQLLSMGVNNVDVKVNHINRLGKFILTPADGGWYIER